MLLQRSQDDLVSVHYFGNSSNRKLIPRDRVRHRVLCIASIKVCNFLFYKFSSKTWTRCIFFCEHSEGRRAHLYDVYKTFNFLIQDKFDWRDIVFFSPSILGRKKGKLIGYRRSVSTEKLRSLFCTDVTARYWALSRAQPINCRYKKEKANKFLSIFAIYFSGSSLSRMQNGVSLGSGPEFQRYNFH